MKANRVNLAGQVLATQPQRFALKASVATLVAVGAMTSASVWAQEVAPVVAVTAAEPATVTVSGVRLAAQNAQTLKKSAEQVVDSIVASDIGKFPDKNVAEILGRVTGVQVVRENGEAGNVIVRGLGGIVTLFNGREMFTAAGRSLFLADVPATMLQRIDVYKTQGADMVEGGTAGVIDVRTNRPFDFKEQVTSINARIENRDKAKSNNPDLSTMYSNRWKTDLGEVGALLGLSWQEGKYHDETAWVSPPMPYDTAVNTVNGVAGKAGSITGMDSMGRVMNAGDRKRMAANLALQWRPSSEVEIYAEAFNTLIHHDSESDFMVGVLPKDGATITTVPGSTVLQSISKENAGMFALTSTQARRAYSRGTQGALGGRWDASPQLRVTTELATTVSNWSQENPILDVYGFPSTIQGSVRNGGGYLTYPKTDITDGKNWNIFQIFDNHAHEESKSHDWRADATYELEGNKFFKDFSGGVRLNERTAQHINEMNGHSMAPGIFSPSEIKANTIAGLGCLSQATGGDYGFSQFWTPCRDYLLNNTAAVRQLVTGSSNASPDDPLSFFKDVEKTTAIYGKTKFGFAMGSVPVDGSLGVRVVKTDQDLSAFDSINGVVKATNISTSSTDVLPSFSLKATLQPDLIARLITGKAIQRANFADYNPGLRLYPSTTTTLSTGNAGNPNLKPIESNNLDATLEWYFAPTGSVTGTVFQHKFKNFLQRKAANETYGGITYLVDRPYNSQDGHLEGFELAYRQFYDKLPGWMSGLGMEANLTYMKGGLTEPSGVTNNFPGMSKWSYNLVGLYEKNAWSARLAYSWRDKFIAEYNYRGCCNLIVDPLRTLDASIGYKINSQLTLTLDGSNLLDQPYNDYHGSPDLPRDIRRYDRTIGLALRWKN